MWRMENVKERERTAKKRKPGRPKKAVRRSTFLMVRLTPTERIIIVNKAKKAGLKPSEWFRKAARSATITPRISPEEMASIRSLAGMANNLNQLTKLAHGQGLLSLVATLREQLEMTDSLMEKLLEHGR